MAISVLTPNYDVINDVIMSDADCTPGPGREPRSVAASLLYFKFMHLTPSFQAENTDRLHDRIQLQSLSLAAEAY